MDVKFMAGAEQEAEEERAAHAAFDAKQERRKEAAAAEDESDDDNFEFEWNVPDPEEKTTEQRALVKSFKTLKKTEDAANKAMRQRLTLQPTELLRPHSGGAAKKLMRRVRCDDGAGPSTAPRGDK
jgi:hypothetical protein